MNFRKNSKGITLIALVITIIVLLILVGVTLSLVAGENGILGRAEKAVDATNISSGKEQAELLIAEYLSEYYQEVYVNSDSAISNQKAEEYIQGKITETGMVTSSGDYFVTVGSDNAITVYRGTSADENNKMAYGSLLSGGKVEWGITVANYGEYVDLGTSYVKGNALETGTATEDWRIFYKDSTGGVYLILADYLPYSYETSSTAGSSTGLGTGLSNKGTDYPYNWMSTTSRIDLITRLNDSNAWNKLLSSIYIAKGITVKGTVDLPTWVASWNEKGYTKLYTNTYSNENGLAQDDGLDGYCVGTSENPTSAYQSVSSDTAGYGNTLYFPRKTTVSNNYAYWLASPSAARTSCVMSVSRGGGVYGSDCNNYYYGARPSVYLPANIEVEKNATTGIWEIK